MKQRFTKKFVFFIVIQKFIIIYLTFLSNTTKFCKQDIIFKFFYSFRAPLMARFLLCSGIQRYNYTLLPFPWWLPVREPTMLTQFNHGYKNFTCGWHFTMCVDKIYNIWGKNILRSLKKPLTVKSKNLKLQVLQKNVTQRPQMQQYFRCYKFEHIRFESWHSDRTFLIRHFSTVTRINKLVVN